MHFPVTALSLLLVVTPHWMNKTYLRKVEQVCLTETHKRESLVIASQICTCKNNVGHPSSTVRVQHVGSHLKVVLQVAMATTQAHKSSLGAVEVGGRVKSTCHRAHDVLQHIIMILLLKHTQTWFNLNVAHKTVYYSLKTY